MPSLKDFVYNSSPCSPILPFTHTTTVSGFEEILDTMALIPKQCDVFNIPLVYLFYGRADYRPNVLGSSFAMPHAKPVTILFKHTALPSSFENSPFDTGAFFASLFSKVVGEYTDDELSQIFNKTYSLYNESDTPSKLVSYLYGNNKNFIESTPKDLSHFSTCLAAQNCHQLASNLGSEPYDSRCCSIESRISVPIEVNNSNVELVIYPFESDGIFKPILSRLGINCESYRKSARCTTSEYMGKISILLEGHYKKLGIL